MNWRVSVLLLAMHLGAALAWTLPAGAASVATPSALRLSERGKGGLVALTDGSVLLWVDDGRIQITGPNGLSSPVLQLDVNSVSQVISDGAGILGWGARHLAGDQRQNSIFRADEKGTVVERWEPSAPFLFSIASHAGRRWVTAAGEWPGPTHVAQFDPRSEAGPVVDLLLELLPGGKTEVRAKVESHAAMVTFSGGKRGTARVDCVPADLTKQNYHASYCAVAEAGGWRSTGLWDVTPLACGAYLIEMLGRFGDGHFPQSKEAPRLTVRRLDTGSVVRTSPISSGQVIACGSSGELLTGRRDIRALSLPDLKPLWRTRSPGGTVVALAHALNGKIWVATPTKVVTLSLSDILSAGR